MFLHLESTPGSIFLKMGQSRPLFVYFCYFLDAISIIQIEKGKNGVNPGRRMVGADETTELWRPPEPGSTLDYRAFGECICGIFAMIPTHTILQLIAEVAWRCPEDLTIKFGLFLFFREYLPIYTRTKICQLLNKSLKLPNIFLNFTKAAKIRQIWSPCYQLIFIFRCLTEKDSNDSQQISSKQSQLPKWSCSSW